MATKFYAFCYPHGLIQISERKLESALLLATSSTKKALHDEIEVAARHGYKSAVLLVPGVPEAENMQEVIDSIVGWVGWRRDKNKKIQ